MILLKMTLFKNKSSQKYFYKSPSLVASIILSLNIFTRTFGAEVETQTTNQTESKTLSEMIQAQQDREEARKKERKIISLKEFMWSIPKYYEKNAATCKIMVDPLFFKKICQHRKKYSSIFNPESLLHIHDFIGELQFGVKEAWLLRDYHPLYKSMEQLLNDYKDLYRLGYKKSEENDPCSLALNIYEEYVSDNCDPTNHIPSRYHQQKNVIKILKREYCELFDLTKQQINTKKIEKMEKNYIENTMEAHPIHTLLLNQGTQFYIVKDFMNRFGDIMSSISRERKDFLKMMKELTNESPLDNQFKYCLENSSELLRDVISKIENSLLRQSELEKRRLEEIERQRQEEDASQDTSHSKKGIKFIFTTSSPSGSKSKEHSPRLTKSSENFFPTRS